MNALYCFVITSLLSFTVSATELDLKSKSFEQTTELLTQVGLNPTESNRTSDKMRIVNNSLEVINHADLLMKAYDHIAVRQLSVLHDPKSDTSDKRFAQDSLAQALTKISTLRKNRQKLVSQLNSLSTIGAEKSIIGGASLSLFDIPEPLLLSPEVEQLIAMN